MDFIGCLPSNCMKIFTVGTNVHFSESEESERHSAVSGSATPWTAAPPGSSVHGILQARIPEWVVIASPKDLADPGIKLGLLNCRRILCHLNHQGTDDNYAPFSGSSIVVISFSMGSTTKSIELCYQKLYRLPSKSKEI